MNVVRTLTAAIAAIGLGAATGYGLAHSGTPQDRAAHSAAAAGPVHGQTEGMGSATRSGRGQVQGQAGGHNHDHAEGAARGQGQGQAQAHEHGQGSGQGMRHGQGAGRGMGQGMGGMGGMMGRFQNDPAGQADMGLVQTMVHGHESITRSVTNLPDGIRTLTESSDPQVAGALQAHVASMVQRLEQGKEFNLFSENIPVLFANRDRIVTRVEMTPRGATWIQTSTDPVVVAALQAHAREVSELANEGMVAMQRGMQRSMGRATGPQTPAAGAPMRTASRPTDASDTHDHAAPRTASEAMNSGHGSHGARATGGQSRASMQTSMQASMHGSMHRPMRGSIHAEHAH